MEVISANVLGDTIDALGLMIAFYYGMTGFSCAWWYRHQLTRSTKDLFLKGVFPLLGGTMLLLFFVKGLIYDWQPANSYSTWKMPFSPHWTIGGTFLTGVGALVLGVVLMEFYRKVNPSFFRGDTLNRATPILITEDIDLGTVAVLGIIAPGKTGIPTGGTTS
jgi:hypothetical protein